MMKRLVVVAGVAIPAVLLLLAWVAWSQSQRADNAWIPKVSRPFYDTRHPRVSIDEAHYNAHTGRGKYRPFGRLLAADGYAVSAGRQRFTSGSLAGVDVLVIVNAAGGPKPQVFGINLPIPTSKKREMPAFARDEIEAVRSWVEAGGSMLLIADHAPFGAAARELAAAFGVTMNQGFVEDSTITKGPGDTLVFSRENGLLGDHPITMGIGRVMTFTGQSLDGPAAASVLLRLSESAVEYVPPGPELKAQPAGKAQGLAMPYGGGRVVILGEAGMLTAQVSQGERFGMNLPDNDNSQFALNIMHWLSHGM